MQGVEVRSLVGELRFSMPLSVAKEKKLNIELPYDPAIPLLHVYLKELKARIRTDPCTPVFIVALFTETRR